MNVIDRRYIRLEFAGLALTLTGTDILRETYPPRKPVEQIEIGRSQYGAFFVYGRAFEDYHRFEFTALITENDRRTIDAMYFRHHQLRRQQQDARILLIDTTAEFTEVAPRTRAIAAAPFNAIATTGTNPQFLSYFAKFYVHFAQRPEYSEAGFYIQVDLAFEESDSKVAIALDG